MCYHTEVAGTHPSVLNGLFGQFRLAIIPFHYLRTPRPYLTPSAATLIWIVVVWVLDLSRFDIDDADFGSGDRRSDRTHNQVVDFSYGKHRGCFGHTVSFEHRYPYIIEEPVYLNGQGSAAGDGCHQ